jgi:hypothetical protein
MGRTEGESFVSDYPLDVQSDRLLEMLSGRWSIAEEYPHGSAQGEIEFSEDGDEMRGHMKRTLTPVVGDVFEVENDLIVELKRGRLAMTSKNIEVGEGGPEDFEPDVWHGQFNKNQTVSGRVFDLKRITGRFLMRKLTS